MQTFARLFDFAYWVFSPTALDSTVSFHFS